jgi:SAM-dependent methyltransferase
LKKHSYDRIATSNGSGWIATEMSPLTEKFSDAVTISNEPGVYLDIGAGNGMASYEVLLNGKNNTVYINDINVSLLMHFQEEALDFGYEESKFFLKPGKFPDDLDFADNFFDAIHCANLIHFLSPEQMEPSFSKIMRWLKPGGKVYLIAATLWMKLFLDIIMDKVSFKSFDGYVYFEPVARNNMPVEPFKNVPESLKRVVHDFLENGISLFQMDGLRRMCMAHGFNVKEAGYYTPSDTPPHMSPPIDTPYYATNTYVIGQKPGILSLNN